MGVCVCSAVKLAEMHGYVSIQSTNTVILCKELKIFVLCVTSIDLDISLW